MASLPSLAMSTSKPRSESIIEVISRLSGSSSTISRRLPEWRVRSARSASSIATWGPVASGDSGRRAENQNVLPAPGALMAPTPPPMISASLRVIASPSPVPP